jgi:hypothetical protein
MIGNSDSNLSEPQGAVREDEPEEAASKGTGTGTRTADIGLMRAMSVRVNAKSESHRKAHWVNAGVTGRKMTDLTQGDLPAEREAEVSRGHSSEESRGNPERVKDRRNKRQTNPKRWTGARRCPEGTGYKPVAVACELGWMAEGSDPLWMRGDLCVGNGVKERW